MKTVIITGAGGNLGKATVDVFVSAGWRVIAIVTPGHSPGATSGSPIIYREADLQNELESGNLIKDLLAEFGQLDAALLLVGGFEAGSVENTDTAALRRMYSLNFETAYHMAKPLASHLQDRGKIIFIGARPALDARAGKGLVAYGLSKSLLFKLAEYLNASAGRTWAHVMVFQALDTSQNRNSMPNADRSHWVAPVKVSEAMLGLVESSGGELIHEIG